MLKTKKELSSQLKDSKGAYNVQGAFNLIKDDMNAELKKFKNINKRGITSREFSKVVWLYFKFVMLDLLDGKRFRLYNRFGELRIAKRKMDRFLPNTRRVRIIDGKRVSVKVDPMEWVKKFGPYWYYLNWDVFKKWRTHELKQGRRFNDAMMRKVERGFDYIDYTPLYKNEGAIRKVK